MFRPMDSSCCKHGVLPTVAHAVVRTQPRITGSCGRRHGVGRRWQDFERYGRVRLEGEGVRWTPMSILFPFHATALEYTDEQTRVYHDRSECSEAQKIRQMHRIDGTGGRTHCKECERISPRDRRGLTSPWGSFTSTSAMGASVGPLVAAPPGECPKH